MEILKLFEILNYLFISKLLREKKKEEGKRVVSKDFFQELMIRIGSRNKLVITKIESRVV